LLDSDNEGTQRRILAAKSPRLDTLIYIVIELLWHYCVDGCAKAYPGESFTLNINFLVSASGKETFGEILSFGYIVHLK